MKKISFTIITVLSIVLSSYSQKVQFGTKAGLNFAEVTGDFSNTKGRTAFHFGGTAEITITEKFSAQPELLFSSQGAKDEDQTLVVNYLHLPIMGKYYATEKLSIEVGPQFGYLLSATIDDGQSNTGGGGTIDSARIASMSSAQVQRPKEDVKEFANDFDFGLNLGLGYKIDDVFHISARYNLGLTKGDNISDDSLNLKNSVIQLSIGYLFK